MAGYASRDTLRVAIVGLVAIAAISMAAASVTQVTQAAGGSSPNPLPGGEGNFGAGGDNSEGGVAGNDEGRSNTGMQVGSCVEFLRSLPGTMLYFGGFGLVLFGLKRRYNFGTAMLSFYGLSPFVLVTYFINTDCATLGGRTGDNSGSGSVVGDVAGTQVATPEISPVVLIAVLGIVLVGAAAVLVRASGDQTIEPGQGEDEEVDQPDVADLAAAAGRAADRMEEHNADVDNEVYRAWWQMTQLLDVPKPESSTAGEFAEAAISLGMNEDDIEQLTTLFNEVRYAKRDPESREDRAIEVFRNIESQYGDDEDRTDAADGRQD